MYATFVTRQSPAARQRSTVRRGALLVLATFAAACGSVDGGGSEPGGQGAPNPTEHGAAQCDAGWIDCDQDPDTCEVDARTDHDNCGACGVDCGDGRCEAGMCSAVTLASGGYEYIAPTGVTVDGEWIYLGMGTQGFPGDRNVQVARVPRDGGSLEAVVRMDEGVPTTQLGVDAKHVYFANYAGLYRAPKDGGEAEQVLLNEGIRQAPSSHLSIDDEAVYVRGVPEELLRVPKDGGVPARALGDEALPASTSAVGKSLYWVSCDMRVMALHAEQKLEALAALHPGGDEGCPTYDLPRNETHLFLGDRAGAAIHRVALDGSGAETLTRDVHPWAMAASERSVYFEADGALWEVPVGGGQPLHLVDVDGAVPTIAADENGLYWIEQRAAFGTDSWALRSMKR